MNNEKARDYFSGYFEGTLETGLRMSLEQKLKTDAQIKAEYRLFERTMADLDTLKFEEIQPPHDLHDRIAARLDLHIFDQKRRERPSLIAGWRTFAIAGIACAAIVGGIFSLRPGVGAAAGATSAGDQLQIAANGNGVSVKFRSATEKTLTITAADGVELVRETASPATPIDRPLVNEQPNPVAVTVSAEGAMDQHVVLPGTQRVRESAGEGSVLDYAKAVAGYYNVVVVLEVKNPGQMVKWQMEGSDVVRAVSTTLGSARYSIDLSSANLLRISDD